MDKPINDNHNHNNSTPHRNNNTFSYLHFLLSQNPPKKSLLSYPFCFPTSVLALILFLLLAYNSFTIFYIKVPVLSHRNCKESEKKLPIFQLPVKQDNPPLFFTTHVLSFNYSTNFRPPLRSRSSKNKRVSKNPPLEAQSSWFSKRVSRFFLENYCSVRVFMTWISSLKSFGEREMFTIESLFNSHPSACLLIVSDSMDSNRGTQILNKFLRLNFRVMAVSPDYGFIFKNSMASSWFDKLEKGNIYPGEVSLGQNMSNLLRLALLYEYGGIYMDTDFVVLKSLEKLRNSIGAQNIDQKTRNWSRLNNAMMIFDKKHPLLLKFIEEFALTFNGNKWGHNGPYLVSRVVEKLNGSMGGDVDFTILPPPAFYPVDWAGIGGLFHRPRDGVHLKWVNSKLKQIQRESYAVHLWNRQSKGIKVEDGSIISHLMKASCVFCNSSTATL